MKLGFMSAFVKAAAHALTDQPAVNAGKTTKSFLSLPGGGLQSLDGHVYFVR